jgi:hypothetical protein
MNPLAFGAFFVLVAGVKCFERVCVVSPFAGIGGSDGLCCCGGACANMVLTDNCNANKTTKAIAGKRDVYFLFIAGFFL